MLSPHSPANGRTSAGREKEERRRNRSEMGRFGARQAQGGRTNAFGGAFSVQLSLRLHLGRSGGRLAPEIGGISARFVFSQQTFPVRRPEPLLSKARSDISAAGINSTAAPVGRASQHREADDEGDRGDGPGCGNGRDEAGGAARAAGGVARQPLGRELRRRGRSGSCVGIHLG